MWTQCILRVHQLKHILRLRVVRATIMWIQCTPRQPRHHLLPPPLPKPTPTQSIQPPPLPTPAPGLPPLTVRLPPPLTTPTPTQSTQPTAPRRAIPPATTLPHTAKAPTTPSTARWQYLTTTMAETKPWLISIIRSTRTYTRALWTQITWPSISMQPTNLAIRFTLVLMPTGKSQMSRMSKTAETVWEAGMSTARNLRYGALSTLDQSLNQWGTAARLLPSAPISHRTLLTHVPLTMLTTFTNTTSAQLTWTSVEAVSGSRQDTLRTSQAITLILSTGWQSEKSETWTREKLALSKSSLLVELLRSPQLWCKLTRLGKLRTSTSLGLNLKLKVLTL